MDTSDRATTLPKYLETFLTSSSLSVAEAVVALICSSPLGPLANVVVEDHRQDQDHADEHLEPVAVDPGDDDSLLDHGEGESSDGGADHGSVAPGEQHPAHHRSDDGVELGELPAQRVGGPGRRHLEQGDEERR